MPDYNQTGDVRDIGVDDHSSGVHYRFWTNGTAVGYEVQFDDGRPIQFFYLNPSDDTDDGVPNVFVYQGTEADPAADVPLCHFVMTDTPTTS